MSELPFSIIVPTAYGQMIVNRHDINQTTSLIKTGVSIDHWEIDILQQILKKCGSDLTFIDVGANFGTFSLGLVKSLGPNGRVHAFEAQRIIYNMMVGSVALNGITNIYCHNMAVGSRDGRIDLPLFDYAKPLNFGSVELGPQQRERLEQERLHDPDRVESIPITTLDRFGFARADMIKIDVEGMETDVLDGAGETIRRCRPVLFIEFFKSDQQALRQRVEAMNYTLYTVGANYLCIPAELSERIRVVAG